MNDQSFWRRLWRLRRLLWADHRLEHLTARLDLQQAEIDRLARQLDALKSGREVAPELGRELALWREAFPLGDQPLVSVCVATFNRAKLLTTRCLPSILGQSYQRLEVIVVGDGCTDDTATRVAGLRDPRVRFLNLPHRGRYPEREDWRWMVAGSVPANVAMAVASGDCVTHLDDDDEYLPQRLEKLLTFMRTTGTDVVWHPFFSEMPDGTWSLNEAPRFAQGMVTTGSVFYRSWFVRVPWDPESYRLAEPGDWNRFRRFQHVGARIDRLDVPLLRHHHARSRGE